MSEELREEWYPADIEFIPSLRAPVYFKNRNDGIAHSISPVEAKILQTLCGCRSIDGHIHYLSDAAADAVAELGADGLEPLVRRWIAEGVLRARSLLVSPAGGDVRDESPSQPPLVATVTANRPRALTQWLDGFATQPPGPVVIVDDSRSEEPIRATVAVVRQFLQKRNASASGDGASGDGAALHVISRAGRQRLARTIAHHPGGPTIDPGLVEWGLLGDTEGYGELVVSIGAARNTLLLAGLQRRVISIDDDILPRYATFADVDPTTVCIDATSTRYARLYPDEETLRTEARSAEDPFDTLVALLGASPPGDADLTGLPADIGRAWEMYTPRVFVARVGIYGARLLADPFKVIRRPEEFGDANGSDIARVSAIQRFGLRSSHTTTRTLGRDGFSSAYYAFDGSVEFLPFFPWGRWEDVVFSSLVPWTDSAALFGDVPVAAYHDPTDKKPFSDMEIGRHSVNIGHYNFLTVRLFMRSIVASDRSRRHSALVSRYRELGTLTPSGFREFLRGVQVSYLREVREEIETQIATHRNERDSLEPYARERLLRRYQDSVIRELANPESVVPTELRGAAGSVEDKLGFLQENYRRWADLLEAWPTIRHAASEIGFDALMKIAADGDA